MMVVAKEKIGKISVAKAEGGELLRFCRSASVLSQRRDDALEWASDIVGVFLTLIAGLADFTLPLLCPPNHLPPCASRSSPPTRTQRAANRTTEGRQNKSDRESERPSPGCCQA